MSRQSSKIGTYGELRVAEILDGSEHPNYITESKLPYDIIWEGIQIDVKTTAQTVPTSEKACTFNVTLAERNNGVVMVFIALLEDKEYFWVEKARPELKGYFRLADSITADELPSKIREVKDKEYPLIENNHKEYGMIRVKATNAREIASLRIRLSYRLGKTHTLEETVMKGIRLLDEMIKRDYEGEKS